MLTTVLIQLPKCEDLLHFFVITVNQEFQGFGPLVGQQMQFEDIALNSDRLINKKKTLLVAALM